MHKPRCGEHPQRPAVARCAVCGVYLCSECIVEVAARAYCSRCMEEARRQQDAAGEAVGIPESTPDPRDSVPPEPPPEPPIEPPPEPPPQPAVEEVRGTVQGRPVRAMVVTTCAFHPGVRAVTRCSECGVFICSGCQRMMGNKRLCEICYQRAYSVARRIPPGTRGAIRPREKPSLAGATWDLWPGLAFLPIPFALSGLMTFMMRQGEDISVGAANLLISLLLYSSMLFFAFVAVSRHGPALEEMGIHGRNIRLSLGMGFIGGSLTFWIGLASSLLSVGLFHRLGWIESWLEGFFDVNVKTVTGGDLFIAGIIIVIAAPICEEFFFRGYLYPAMRNRMGVWGAVFLNGFLFSVVHFSLFGLIGRTLAGALFCLLYEYNDNLVAPITAHAINNFVAFFLPLAAIWGIW